MSGRDKRWIVRARNGYVKDVVAGGLVMVLGTQKEAERLTRREAHSVRENLMIAQQEPMYVVRLVKRTR